MWQPLGTAQNTRIIVPLHSLLVDNGKPQASQVPLQVLGDYCMRSLARWVLRLVAIFLGLAGLHLRLLSLPYYWDEAGYYIPAAQDFLRSGLLIPQSTLTTGHTPLVPV